ncbi:MAG TPA: Na/Pi symporter [Chitinophagaceae bacterium]|nr:Na/Pi symporter [Chitinophagaceae bacterium]
MHSILLILTGLILFLYALNNLSQGLKELSGDKLKTFLNRFTNNVFKGILSGIVVTILLDSSSVVIIMAIALVSSGALTFRQAMGIVMGANIGTTFSSQIFALNLGAYAAIPIAGGFILLFFAKKALYRNLGKVIFSFGLLFFGLFTIEEAVAPLKESDYFVHWLVTLEHTWKGLLTGTAVTIAVQSSSATVGMVIGLANQDLISLTAGIAVMLGAELGTCADTLIASVGRSRAAVKTGLFHLLFNILTILLGMLLLPYFTALVLWVSRGMGVAQTIANAHMLFNGLGVLVLLPFLPLFEQLLERSFPEKKGTDGPRPLLPNDAQPG